MRASHVRIDAIACARTVGVCARAPTCAAHVRIGVASPASVRALTPPLSAIRRALIELAPPDPLRDGAPDLFFVHAFDTALGTGLRLGELRALRWRDVDRDRSLLRVQRAYSRRELKAPKTQAGTRSVPLFASVRAALDALAARAIERGRYAPDELVFATVRGTPLHESNLNAFRHARGQSAVSRLVAAGADVKLVHSVAGHASPVVTLGRYSHLLDARVTEAAERFDAAAAAR